MPSHSSAEGNGARLRRENPGSSRGSSQQGADTPYSHSSSYGGLSRQPTTPNVNSFRALNASHLDQGVRVSNSKYFFLKPTSIYIKFILLFRIIFGT